MRSQLVFDHYPMPPKGVPNCWATASIGQVAKVVASGFPSGEHNQEQRGTPHLRPMNINREGCLDLGTLKYVEGDVPRELSKGDVLFNNTNSPDLIGKTTAILIDTRLGYSNHMTRIQLEEGMSPVFVARQLHFLWMVGYFRHRCVNHVNQASISAEPLSETVPLLVAPTAEQNRIGDSLDELLSDLDAGVEAFERVKTKLARYRASVLKAAVEGTLTSEWRQQHPRTEPASELLKRILAERRRRWEEEQLRKFKEKGQESPENWSAKYSNPHTADIRNLPPLPEGWCWATMHQLSWASGYGTSQKCRETDTGLAVLRIPNIIRGDLDLANLKYASPEHSADHEDLVGIGDLLVVRTNGSQSLIGRGAVIRATPALPLGFASYLIRLRLAPLPNLLEWVSFLWQSSHVRHWIETHAATSAGQFNISLGVLTTLAVPLPPSEEQEVLAETLEDQLSVIEYLEDDLHAKVRSAQALRHSILRHAFTGRLVSQDPNDEPAAQLLKRIAAERETHARGAGTPKCEPVNTAAPPLAARRPRKKTTKES